MINESPLRVEDALKRYGGRAIWDGISFSASPGSVTVVRGPSGSGKSTLVNCLGLLDRVDRGRIFWGDQEIGRLRGHRATRFRRHTISYLFQSYALVGDWNARQNVALSLTSVPSLLSGQRRKTVEEALEAVGMGGRGDEPIFRLSGGEQQRVAVARLLVRRTPIVLADEPTASLDTDNARFVLDELEKVAVAGSIVVIVSHNEEVIARADRVVTL